MDPETENLYMIKKHNRRIVQRAFRQSDINANYNFPKKCTVHETESDLYDNISLGSRVSQSYDLHHQNVFANGQNEKKQRCIMPISDLLKDKINKKKQKITKTTQNHSITQSYQKTQSQQKHQKRKYLSISSRKTDMTKILNLKNYQKQSGIKITTLMSQNVSSKKNLFNKSTFKKEFQNFASNLFGSIEKLAQRCFSSGSKKIVKITENELIFHSQIMTKSRQKNLWDQKIPITQRTVDTTPKISFNDYSSSSINAKKGFKRFNSHQNINTSPFIFI